MILGIVAVIYGAVTLQWFLMLIVVAVIVVILLGSDVLHGNTSPSGQSRTPEETRMRHYEQSLESIRREIGKL